jgi:hypothetical protein
VKLIPKIPRFFGTKEAGTKGAKKRAARFQAVSGWWCITDSYAQTTTGAAFVNLMPDFSLTGPPCQ